ncbi:hypothetical protein [Rhizobium ruizarguesonis]|uniref:hypothetical protein n=1 Tax=Rhizobium ruizarguesonis TaxID=2081791 RepID=UPI0010321459|nr:hypothetical protein [Rhizobium ruizarguesonis]TAZ53244.1 hypothetical protein ELH76_19825 [Rhizobium ruizarguesonis]
MRYLFSVIFILINVGNAFALSDFDPRENLIVFWQGSRIQLEYHQFDFGEWSSKDVTRLAKNKSTTGCPVGSYRTECYKIARNPPNDRGPGSEYIFTRPIAVFPQRPVDWDSPIDVFLENVHRFFTQEEKKDALRFEAYKDGGLDQAEIAKLPPYNTPRFSEQEISRLSRRAEIGRLNEHLVFSKASFTLGGDYALSIWKKMLGKLPSRTCAPDDDCTVVVNATADGDPAFAHCRILNTPVGLGLPFNCSLLAYNKHGDWYVYAYAGPEICECGGGAGASCSVETTQSLESVSDLVRDSLLKGKTNINTSVWKKSTSRIAFAGKNIAVSSKFYRGYFDKSYAAYQVERREGDAHVIEVSGLFNLLISASPTLDGNEYREFGSANDMSPIVWFQGQVLNIIKTALSKIGSNVDCQAVDIL